LHGQRQLKAFPSLLKTASPSHSAAYNPVMRGENNL
jgi:hypothetical protein